MRSFHAPVFRMPSHKGGKGFVIFFLLPALLGRHTGWGSVQVLHRDAVLLRVFREIIFRAVYSVPGRQEILDQQVSGINPDWHPLNVDKPAGQRNGSWNEYGHGTLVYRHACGKWVGQGKGQDCKRSGGGNADKLPF